MDQESLAAYADVNTELCMQWICCVCQWNQDIQQPNCMNCGHNNCTGTGTNSRACQTAEFPVDAIEWLRDTWKSSRHIRCCCCYCITAPDDHLAGPHACGTGNRCAACGHAWCGQGCIGQMGGIGLDWMPTRAFRELSHQTSEYWICCLCSDTAPPGRGIIMLNRTQRGTGLNLCLSCTTPVKHQLCLDCTRCYNLAGTATSQNNGPHLQQQESFSKDLVIYKHMPIWNITLLDRITTENSCIVPEPVKALIQTWFQRRGSGA